MVYLAELLVVRTHNSTATGASLVARPGTNPVPVVFCRTVTKAPGRAVATGREVRESGQE